jgi:hypothetical protein
MVGGPGTTPGVGGTGEIRLRARGAAVINGVEAELRGNFEIRPDRTRLDGELEDVNLPVGFAVSFCLVQGSNTIPLAVGIVTLEDDRKEAEFHIRTDEGQTPPTVQIGDILQARDGANGSVPDCSLPLLVTGTFALEDDNNSGNGSGPGDEFRLRARGEAVVSGIEAELRAEFERRPDRTRLDGELEDINNLPIGTLISFCLVQDGNTVPLAVGTVHQDDQRRETEFSIRTDDGEQPPDVVAGNVLEARLGASAGAADCSKTLLVSAPFVPDN